MGVGTAVSEEVLVVLDDDAHGIPAARYAAILERRLPGWEVVHPQSPAGRSAAIAEATVIAGKEFAQSEVSEAGALRLFSANTAGVDHLPLDAFADAGIAVTSASGVHGPNIAEHVIGYILSFMRRHEEGRRRQRARTWRRYQAFGELAGSTVTVVGLGAIGEAVCDRLDAFGVELIGVRHDPRKQGPVDRVVGYDALGSVLPATDVLILACPLTPQTDQLIDAAALAALPTDAIVVNIGRGRLIDTDALVDALQANQLHGVALDVTDPEPLPAEHPLWGLPHVYLTPHVAGHTPRYFERCAEILTENIEALPARGVPSGLRNQVV